MRTDIQKRLRYIPLIGLGLFSAGCNNPTDIGKSAATAQPEVIQLTEPQSAPIETPIETEHLKALPCGNRRSHVGRKRENPASIPIALLSPDQVTFQ